MKSLRQYGTKHRSRNDGEKSRQLENSVSPGKQSGGQQFGKKSIFGRTEQRRLGTGQKNDRVRHKRIASRKRQNREEHGSDFKPFSADGDRTFAVAVGKMAANHRKKQERYGKQNTDQKNAEVFFGLRRVMPKDEKNDKKFQAVVVECALKLGDDQARKAATPVWRAAGSVFGH